MEPRVTEPGRLEPGLLGPDRLLRAIRRVRELSQRELAEAVGIPRSTVDRIESGRSTRPSLELIERILYATGFHIVISDLINYNVLGLADGKRGLWDRAGRRYPAHLPLVWVRDRETYWWGWHRIAWNLKDPEVPVFTYYRRSRLGAPLGRWDDAT